MSSDRDPQFFMNVSEAEGVKTAVQNGISYRNLEDAMKFVQDWRDFCEIARSKQLLIYASSTHVILSTTQIWDEVDGGIELW